MKKTERITVFIVLFSCIALGACGASHRPVETSPAPADQQATLEVDNRGFLDMNVYVLNGDLRVRLGTANANRVTRLTIPSYLIRSAPIRFLCDPIGSSRAPVSDEILVSPGDEVSLVIPAI